MKHAVGILLASCLSIGASAGIVRNVTDTKAVSFDWPMPIGDGSEVLVVTSSNQFGGNPEHRYQIVSFDPSTGTGTPLTAFDSSLTHVRHNLSVSDDGLWVAFLSDGDPVPGQNGDRNPEVFVMMRDGTQLAQLTDESTPNGGSVSRLALSGSGNRIAFASNSDLLGSNGCRIRQVFVIDRDGTNLTQMTQATEGDIQHLWISDDGNRIAFSHNGDLTGGNPEKNHEIFTIAVGDATPRQVTSSVTGESQAANISGDGETIVFHSNADLTGGNPDFGLEIFAADWATATISQVTSNAPGRNARQGWPTNDGQQIFFASNADPLPEGVYEVFRIDTDGTDLTQLTSLGLQAEHPVVSGDGSRFAHWDAGGLYAGTAAGTNVLQLIVRSTPEATYMDITGDGQWLSWSSEADPLGTNPDGGQEVFVQHADGTQLTQVTNTPTRSAGRATISGDGSRVYFESSEDFTGGNPGHYGEIFGMDVDGTNPVQLTTCDSPQWFSVHPVVADDHSVVFFSSLCDLTGGNADHSGEIFRVDPQGGNVTQLTSGPGAGDGSTYVYFPRSDATGNWIVFSGNNDIDGGNADNSFEVWRMRSDGTNLERLTTDPVQHSFYPDISDDASRIVFLSRANLTGQNAANDTELFLYEPATATTTQLTDISTGSNFSPRISGSGEYVYFLSDAQYFEPDPDGGRIELYRMHIDTQTVERAGGLAFEENEFLYWPVVDDAGDRVMFNSIGNPSGGSPDRYWDVFLVDHTAPNPIEPSPGPAPTTVSWMPEPGSIRYDVVRGDVGSLQANGGNVDLGPVVCLEDDSADTTTVGFEDATGPAPGEAWFYVFRGSMGLGAPAGSYGSGTGDLDRVAGPGDCTIAGLTASCGNCTLEAGEVCDGPDLGGETCISQGFDGGDLACNAGCDGFDTSDCASCGDSVCQPSVGEDCLSCPSDCNGQQSGNPGQQYCCGDGAGTNPVPCSDARCNADGNTCTE